MNKQKGLKVWFPDFELIELLYKRKLTHFHGIGHILRVWTISMLLAEKRKESIDTNVLSAAALFHDIGRETDFVEKSHGQKSAQWIKDFLPIISDFFSKNQIDFISSLAKLHCENDNKYLSLELKILKDADALDRHRLPRKYINIDKLRLEESKNLVPVTAKFFKNWKNLSKNNSETLKTWKESAKKCDLRKFLPNKILNNNCNEKANELHKRIRFYDSQIIEIKRITGILLTKLRDSKITESSIQKLYNNLDILKKSSLKDFLYNVVCLYTFEYVWGNLYELKDSRSHSKSIEKIKSKLLHYIWKSIQEFQQSPIHTKENLFYILKSQKLSKNLFNALIEYLARFDKDNELKILTSLIIKRYQKYSIDIFKKLLSLSDIFSLKKTFFLNNSAYKWTNLKIIQFWIIGVSNDYSISDEKVKYVYEFLANQLNELICKNSLNILFINKILDTYNKIIDTLDKRNISSNLNPLEQIFQAEIITNAGICNMGKIGVNNKINIFYLYYPSLNETELSDYFFSLEKLLIKHSRYYSIDSAFYSYLLPIHLNKVFNYSISKALIKKINSKEKYFLYEDLYKKFPESDISDLTYKVAKIKSKENLSKILNKNKYDSFIQDDDNYRIISNFTSIDLLKNLILNKSDLLTIYNIPNRTRPLFLATFLSQEDKFFESKFHRDSLQREMILRKPNYQRKHVYYGSLQNINSLLKTKNLIEKIPTPTELFVKYRYGNVILVFKKQIKDRTIFTLYDTAWENRKYPFVFEEAKYVYEKVTKEPLSPLKANPLTITTAYVEADILNGVTFNDVEMIIAPERVLNKNLRAQKIILKRYPHIIFKCT